MGMTIGVKRQATMGLVFLGALPLPMAAGALDAYVVTRRLPADPLSQQLLSGLFLLVLTAFLVVWVVGFVVWRSALSAARAPEDGAEAAEPEEPAREGPEQAGLMTNAVSRMLATIERQAKELDRLDRRLERAHREIQSARTRVQGASPRDDVTGLHDGASFCLRLEEETARCRRFGHPLSLVLLGLDSDTSLDEAGSPCREETRRGIAEILLRGSRTIDVVGCHGADTFAVLLVETTRTGAHAYAQRIGETLAAASFGHGRRVTANLGVASLPEGGATGDDLVRGAEEALHAVRQAGRRGVAVWEGRGIACRAGLEVPAR
jgi:diguanylate cyclase (GGDEF)-like protein